MSKEDSEPSYRLLSSSDLGHSSNLPTVNIEEVPETRGGFNYDDIDKWVDLASMYVSTNKSLPDEYKKLKLSTTLHGVFYVTFKRLLKEHSNVDSGEELEVDWNLVWEGMNQAVEERRARDKRSLKIALTLVLLFMVGVVMIISLAIVFDSKKKK